MMDNSNSPSSQPYRQHGANNGDSSIDTANHLLDNRWMYPATVPTISDAMNQGSAINSALQHHQALLALGGQYPHQDYANLMATAARSMILLQGANVSVGQSSAPAQAFGFSGTPALNLQGGAVVPLSASQGQPWLMPPHQQTLVSLAGVDPRLLAQLGGAGAAQPTASPSPHQLLAASALLSQIGQANLHQQQHPSPTQLQQPTPANLGAALQAQLMPAVPVQHHPAGTNPPAGALVATPQGDASALLRAFLCQQQNSVTPAQMGSMTQPGVASLLSSGTPGASLTASGSNVSVAHTSGAASARPSQGGPPLAREESQLSGRPPVCLHLDLDEQTLSDYQCLLRKHIELFETRPEDIQSGVQGRNTPIRVGQVGIRCRHCSNMGKSETSKTCDPASHARRPKKGTIYYSRTLDGLYQVAQNLTKVHLCNSCPNIPGDAKARLSEMQKVNKRTSGGKEYWVYGLKELGVYEDKDMLRFRPLPPATARSNEGPAPS
jgi:hypothetical protein